MVDYMRIMRELMRADEAHSKESECLALSQVAWLCMHEIGKLSNNEEAMKIKDMISDLNMKRFIKEDN